MVSMIHDTAVCVGVVWCGVVWCGVVWCGVVWCGVVWCGVVWCGVVWCYKVEPLDVFAFNVNNRCQMFLHKLIMCQYTSFLLSSIPVQSLQQSII